jgi:hypothetical protein
MALDAQVAMAGGEHGVDGIKLSGGGGHGIPYG